MHEFLHRRFHGAQHEGRRAHAHHLQRAAGLVQLLARDAQRPGVQRGEIGLARGLGIAHEAAHGLDGAVERLAQLIQHPGQGPEILLSLAPIRGRCVCGVNR
ncbi:hypothetical protein ACFSPA_21750 [Paracidovorax citrulli]|uniref:hypothetical protein n=1 Tax=Paracidovorax citrulli TaxID=80869 RepID=UPI00363E096C